MQTESKVYRSRISVLVLLFILIVFIPMFKDILYGAPFPAMVIMGLTLLFVVTLFAGMRYCISGNKIIIKIISIPFGSINIDEISSIKRSYNPLSSPAASLRRLALYRRRSLYSLISPVREEEFIEELKSINPRIVVDDNINAGKRSPLDWDI